MLDSSLMSKALTISAALQHSLTLWAEEMTACTLSEVSHPKWIRHLSKCLNDPNSTPTVFIMIWQISPESRLNRVCLENIPQRLPRDPIICLLQICDTSKVWSDILPWALQDQLQGQELVDCGFSGLTSALALPQVFLQQCSAPLPSIFAYTLPGTLSRLRLLLLMLSLPILLPDLQKRKRRTQSAGAFPPLLSRVSHRTHPVPSDFSISGSISSTPVAFPVLSEQISSIASTSAGLFSVVTERWICHTLCLYRVEQLRQRLSHFIVEEDAVPRFHSSKDPGLFPLGRRMFCQ